VCSWGFLWNGLNRVLQSELFCFLQCAIISFVGENVEFWVKLFFLISEWNLKRRTRKFVVLSKLALGRGNFNYFFFHFLSFQVVDPKGLL
jgi:hypothetical protein